MIEAIVVTAALLASPPVAVSTAQECFWVKGRLTVGNGTPSVRIRPEGTKRLIGVVTRSGDAEGDGLLPSNVERLKPDFDREIWGRFHVCPTSEDRPGSMRLVVLVNAKGLRAAAR